MSLAQVMALVYDRGHFERLIDYTRDPDPPLPESDAEWADTLLREAGRR